MKILAKLLAFFGIKTKPASELFNVTRYAEQYFADNYYPLTDGLDDCTKSSNTSKYPMHGGLLHIYSSGLDITITNDIIRFIGTLHDMSPYLNDGRHVEDIAVNDTSAEFVEWQKKFRTNIDYLMTKFVEISDKYVGTIPDVFECVSGGVTCSVSNTGTELDVYSMACYGTVSEFLAYFKILEERGEKYVDAYRRHVGNTFKTATCTDKSNVEVDMIQIGVDSYELFVKKFEKMLTGATYDDVMDFIKQYT